MAQFIIRDREAGNEIARFNSYEDAKAELKHYEETDKAEGSYEKDFYEIIGKKYVVSARTTEVKTRLDREEAAQLTADILNKKVEAQIDRTMNGTPDEEHEFDTLEEALKKYEELKDLELTIYHESNALLDIYQVYIDEYNVDECGDCDSCETIHFYTDSTIRWAA